MGITEIVTTGTEIEMDTGTGTETETATDETIDADLPVTMAHPVISKLTGVLMMKTDVVTIDVTTKMVNAEDVATKPAVGGKEEMVSVLRKGDRRHLKVLFRCLSVNAKHLAGTSMPPDMNNILPCRRSKQVFSTCQVLTVPRFHQFLALQAFHRPFQSRHSVWESAATRTCLGSLVGCTLAASLQMSMNKI
jgi:hypothetical protein